LQIIFSPIRVSLSFLFKKIQMTTSCSTLYIEQPSCCIAENLICKHLMQTLVMNTSLRLLICIILWLGIQPVTTDTMKNTFTQWLYWTLV
jgi:hypothetical protein